MMASSSLETMIQTTAQSNKGGDAYRGTGRRIFDVTILLSWEIIFALSS
jgi:hypothetical protein